MRKATFYPRLAVQGLWRNRSTYLPYLIACVVCVITFYTLISINFNQSVREMRGGSYVYAFTQVGAFVLAIFGAALLFYTNSFLIKRRKRELALYSVLGMEKRNIAVLLLLETLFLAGIALGLGLAGGALLSRLLFLILLRLVRFPVTVDLPVSAGALLVTAGYFAVVFLLTMLTNLRGVHTANPVELMAGSRQGEREPKSSWLLTAIGLLSLGGGYVMAQNFRNAIDAILFFFVAVLLVIIGTYCLFISGSVAVLKALRRNKGFYYKPNHFIPVSGMLYRMKQNASGLATICILSCMVLVTVSSTVALYVGSEDSLFARYTREYELSLNDESDAEQVLAGVDRLLADHGLTRTRVHSIRHNTALTLREGDEYVSVPSGGRAQGIALFQFVPLADYNQAEGHSETLAPGEALLFSTGQGTIGDAITVDGISYRVRKIPTYLERQYGEPDVGETNVLVLPDEAAIARAAAARPPEVREVDGEKPPLQRTVLFDADGYDETDAVHDAFYDDFRAWTETIHTSATFQFSSRAMDKEGWYLSNGGFLFLGIYFGVLFLMAASMIIYYKQLSEGSDDVGRYEILQKVGMSGDEVKRSINGQILAVFFLPLLVAVVHIGFAFHAISKAIVLFGIFNTTLLFWCTVGTVIVYGVVYVLVYRATAGTYYRLVRRQA